MTGCTHFFVSIELVVCRFYQLKKATELQPGMKDVIVVSVLQDDDVELQWSLLSVELEEICYGLCRNRNRVITLTSYLLIIRVVVIYRVDITNDASFIS